MSIPSPLDSVAAPTRTLFRSFWMGGFEGADHINSAGVRLAMNAANHHWQRLSEDYAMLSRFGIRTVRESIGWRAFADEGIDAGQRRLRHIARTARDSGLQVIWTLHHYGVPAGADMFSEDFAERFADYAGTVARTLKCLTDEPALFQPINEISFLSWAVSSTPWIHPYLPAAPARGYELKCRLVRAAIQACEALWAVSPDARIVHTDPLIYITSSPGHERIEEACLLDAQQYEAFDMLCGRLEPGLGGAPRYLDVLGLNYYHNNQWEHPTQDRLHWHLRDPRRRDLVAMLSDVRRRYGRPIFLAETGHFGEGRAEWIDDVAAAALRCREAGVPLEGICLYPLIDRPDWEDPQLWHHSGLWDLEPRSSRRILHRPSDLRLRHWQRLLPNVDRSTLHSPRNQEQP